MRGGTDSAEWYVAALDRALDVHPGRGLPARLRSARRDRAGARPGLRDPVADLGDRVGPQARAVSRASCSGNWQDDRWRRSEISCAPAPATRTSGCASRTTSWTWSEVVDAAAQRAAFFRAHAPADAPFHVGVLLDNVPEFWFTLCAAALAGATVVGINPTRRGAELGARHRAHRLRVRVDRDARTSACSTRPVTSLRPDAHARRRRRPRGPRRSRRSRARRFPTPRSPDRPVHVDLHVGHDGRAEGGAHGPRAARGLRREARGDVRPRLPTTSATPSCRSSIRTPRSRGSRTCSRRARPACCAAASRRPTSCPTSVATASRSSTTSASRSATSSRRPNAPDDADNSLRFAFGNEAAPLDVDRFAARFGCIVADGYGSTEGGLNMSRRRPTRRRVRSGCRSRRSGPRSSIPTPARSARPREFDADGRLLNADAAIGEIVNPDGGGGFEGYYNNPEADAERVRDGVYWTGDLGYRDEHGFFYFAGRSGDWLRVDGENFAATPGRAGARAPSRCRARRGVRGAVGRGRRRGHGRAARTRRVRLRPGRVRRVPRRAARRLAQVDAALRARHRRTAVDRDPEGVEACAAARALGVRRPGLVATRARAALPAV